MSNNVLANVVSSNKKTHILLLSFSFFLFIYQILFAEQFPSESDVNFSLKLEIVVDKFSSRLLKNESKEVIAVVDIFNYETQERDARGDAIEEKLTNLLYEKLPNQVVPNFEILYLRQEWKNRFPEYDDLW